MRSATWKKMQNVFSAPQGRSGFFFLFLLLVLVFSCGLMDAAAPRFAESAEMQMPGSMIAETMSEAGNGSPASAIRINPMSAIQSVLPGYSPVRISSVQRFAAAIVFLAAAAVLFLRYFSVSFSSFREKKFPFQIFIRTSLPPRAGPVSA